jgi:hypothetical protein
MERHGAATPPNGMTIGLSMPALRSRAEMIEGGLNEGSEEGMVG